MIMIGAFDGSTHTIRYTFFVEPHLNIDPSYLAVLIIWTLRRIKLAIFCESSTMHYIELCIASPVCYTD